MRKTRNNTPEMFRVKAATPLQGRQADSLAHERKRLAAPLASSPKLIAEYASTAPQVLQEIRSQRYEAYSHWGLNE
jgi:hypothetical protein